MDLLLKTTKHFLYTSSNTNSFHINLYFWLFLKTGLSLYYGFNIRYAICGYLFWSFWEYTYHRFIMHGLKDTVYYYKLHGYHHAHPMRPSHIPIFQYLLVSPTFFVAAYYMNPSIVYSYALGHLSGLYCFEQMHHFIHNDVKQEQIYTKYHLYHHRQSNTAFCFTTPCFDILCGTFPDKMFSYNFIAMLPIPYFSFYGLREQGTYGFPATPPS